MNRSLAAGRSIKLEASGGVCLAADVAGPPDGAPVILAHGGGQTRQSWDKAVAALAADGYHATNLDLRGHGESDWAAEYGLRAFADDLAAVCRRQSRPPVLVGASLGGLASLLVAGREPALVAALVLVDVAPQVELAGAQRIRDFMLRHAETGFADLDEAADAVADYAPHRPRPTSAEGLRKNLRLRADGRYYWHWDPKFLQGERGIGLDPDEMDAAAGAVHCPVLLVRGALSDVVSHRSVAALREGIPQLEYIETAGAGHMVAGDRNEVFLRDLQGFLKRMSR